MIFPRPARWLLASSALALAGLGAAPVAAQQIASRPDLQFVLSGGSTLETFSAFSAPAGLQLTVPGPSINIGGVTYASVGPESFFGTNLYVPGIGYLGFASQALLAGTNTLRITFDAFTQAFGLDLAQYAGFGTSATFNVFGTGNILLGTGQVGTPDAPASSFFGWYNLGGVTSLELTSGYDWSPIIDNLEFGLADTDVVPEPATMTLLATGLAGMAAARRKKRKA